jgi:hypothetical protein
LNGTSFPISAGLTNRGLQAMSAAMTALHGAGTAAGSITGAVQSLIQLPASDKMPIRTSRTNILRRRNNLFERVTEICGKISKRSCGIVSEGVYCCLTSAENWKETKQVCRGLVVSALFSPVVGQKIYYSGHPQRRCILISLNPKLAHLHGDTRFAIQRGERQMKLSLPYPPLKFFREKSQFHG